MKCLIYARTATTTQESDHAIRLQIEECEKYAKENDCEIAEIYSDCGKSGNDFHRSGLNELLARCHFEKIDAVLVYSVDRLARNVTHYYKIKEILQNKDVKIFTVVRSGMEEDIARLYQENT